ncbi:MAG: glycosyltransferase family A protein [Candidatus Hodarchaeales archaeon]
MPEIITVIPARNEENNIIATLNALDFQTVPIRIVIIVDDGSTDETVQILKNYHSTNFKLVIKARPNRKNGPSLVGTPAIATTFNLGFKEASKSQYDYIMILGADCILETRYIEKLLLKFEQDSSLAIASGQSVRININPTHARGSGRIIDYRFWKHYGEKYPVIYGWEDDCLMQCQRMGLKVRSYKGISFKFTRRDQGTIDFMNWGRATRSMKYNPIIVLLRAGRFLLFQKYGIKATVRFLTGYLSSRLPEDVSSNQKRNRDYLRNHQLRELPRKIFSLFK